VLPELEHHGQSLALIDRLRRSAAEPVDLDGQHIEITCSLGVTFYPQADEVEADQLLRQADQAMYQAKLLGKNRYQLFDPEQDRDLRGRHEKLIQIAQALERDEFELHYQPKVNMCSGQVIGVEALIRWNHPSDGLMQPGAFLPLIEAHPLIVQLGDWTLERSLKQMEQWAEAGLQLSVSVNIAARHLQQEDFTQRLESALLRHPKVSARQLELEVLETSALENTQQVSRVIDECRRLGVNFSLDDFGTGFSSLSYLKRLPVQLLKIDRSFVLGMLDDPEDLTILQGIINLAQSFHRGVIAEGVETSEHGELLLFLGCELGQGYAIARPMPADELPAWTEHWTPPKHWRLCRSLNADKLPLLYAMVQSRHWVEAIAQSLEDEDAGLPEIDPHACGFDILLEQKVASAWHPQMNDIKPLYQTMKSEAEELISLKTSGRKERALQLLPELSIRKDRLTQLFWRLLRE
jgi:EAL domain-containing protein (putative c-di-GMP-specific phosphodiesterase class I)